MATYEYESKFYDLPEGLTNAQAIQKIQAHLGATAPKERGAMEQVGRQLGLAGRAMYQGFTAPATAALDFVSGAYNVASGALGSESRLPLASREESQMLTNIGLPAPETGAERAVQAGMQSLTSTAGMARAAPAVFGQDLARQLPAATAGAVAAQPTAEKVKELTGSDLAATVAGLLAGGVTGKAAGDLAGKVAAGRQPIMTMDEVRRRAERSYTEVTNAGIQLNQPAGQALVTAVTDRLNRSQFLPESAAPVQAVLNRMNQATARGALSFDDVSELRKLTNTLKSNQDQNVRRLAGVMTNEIDEFVSRLSPRDVTAGAGQIDDAVRTLTRARRDWRNLSRANMLDDVLNTAEARALSPTASESELIRRGFINLAANKEKMRLFNDNEQNAIKAVAKGGSLDPLLSLAARFNPARSQLIAGGAVGGGIFGSPESLMYSGPMMAGGFAADKLQGLTRQRSAQQAISGLLSGTTPAPLPSTYGPGMFGAALAMPPDDIKRAETY